MTSIDTSEWSYEYLPYVVTEADGSERELPNYRIFPVEDPEHYIAQTNEDLPGVVQEAHARQLASSQKLLDALHYFFNIMHDYESSLMKGYVGYALDKARDAIISATGKARI